MNIKTDKEIISDCLSRSQRATEDSSSGITMGIEEFQETLSEIAERGGDLNMIHFLFFSDEVVDLTKSSKQIKVLGQRTGQIKPSFSSPSTGKLKQYGNVQKSLNQALKNIAELPPLQDVPGISQERLSDINNGLAEIPILLDTYFRIQREKEEVVPSNKTLYKIIKDFTINRRIYLAMIMLVKAGYKKTPATEALAVIMKYAPTEGGEELSSDTILKRFDRYKKKT